MHAHGIRQIDGLAEASAGGMAEANGQEIEIVALDQLQTRKQTDSGVHLQNDGSNLRQVGRAVICPLQLFPSPVASPL